MSNKYPDMKRNYTISLTPNELALIHKASVYARMRPDEFIVAAARHTVAAGDANSSAILKARKEEETLLGIKRID